MASSIISISASSSPLHLNPSQPPPIILHSPTSPPPLHFSGGHLFCRRRKAHRGMSVLTRGAPGPSTYIFAFVFPLSLLAVTIFTSIRIADKLDQDFLEEVLLTPLSLTGTGREIRTCQVRGCSALNNLIWYLSLVHGAVGVGLAGTLILVVDVRFIISAIQLAINQSILEEAEEEDFNLFMEEEAATPRTRNRPKREAATEPSSSV
ncbi:hypothetical protein LguiB_011252 [Lonicera macranthoides]